MTAELAARAGDPAAWAGVEVEYVDPDRGRERGPLAACWSARFERVGPVRGFCVIPWAAELAGLVVVLPHRRARRL